MPTPKPYTAEEEQRMLIDHIRAMATYWATQPGKTAQERCDGLAFSILATLDGDSPEIPAYHLHVSTHVTDKAYHLKRGERWHRNKLNITENAALHELYYKAPSP